MELSRQMLLLTAENYGSYYLHITKSPQGNIFVIDCDVRINTPDLKCEGIRKLSNEVEFTL